MKPLLSLVTGTFQRLDYLRAMIASVRDQLPAGFPLEVIVVDGGSTDGTPEWCAQQADVTFIQQGKLLGAIQAFDAGAEAAQGDFVLLANDDILFHAGGIVRALNHLLHTPTCAAVAFMDNRRAPGYDTDAYKVQTIRAVDVSGTPLDVVYAQVGMFRKALGDEAGWWGSRDDAWGESHTYGGDARLSARLWEMGYTVDAVEGAAVTDRVAPDALRQQNHAVEQRIGSAYYRKYPNGVPLGARAQGVEDTLRILYLPLFSPGYGRYKRGLYDALARVGSVYELDYLKHRSAFASAVAAFQPHLILTQFHDTSIVNAAVLEHARAYAPEAVVVNWNGDYYPDQLTAPDMLALLEHVDLQLTVNTDVFPIYEAHNIRAAYWQIAAEPVSENLPEAQSYNLLFMGNAYSPARHELGAVLRQIDRSTGLFGWGWDNPSGNSFYNFDLGAALYGNCKIAIGDSQWKGAGFVSNRFFEATHNGAFLLHQEITGMEELTGYIDGVHYVSWADFDDLREKVKYYLAHEPERRAIAAAGAEYSRRFHSFDARVTELFEKLLPGVENERLAPMGSPEPVLAQGEVLDERNWFS